MKRKQREALMVRIETALVTDDVDYKDMILRQCLAALPPRRASPTKTEEPEDGSADMPDMR